MNAGDRITLALAAGTALTLTVPSGAAGTLTRLSDQPGGGDPFAPAALNGADVTVGPFASPRRYMITCSAGAIAYDEAAAAATGGGGGTLPSGVVTANGDDGPVPTTALTIYDCASDPTALSTSGTPLTVDLGPRLYRITTGGTAGVEEVHLPFPAVPLGGFLNDTLVGLRITFSLGTLTDPADVVEIHSDSGVLNLLMPRMFGTPTVSSVSLSWEGAAASFVWVGDDWVLDSAITDGEYVANYAPGQSVVIGDHSLVGTDNNGLRVLIYGGDAEASGDGGDVILIPGQAGGDGGQKGVVMCDWPTSDPLRATALWNDGGTLKVSAGA